MIDGKTLYIIVIILIVIIVIIIILAVAMGMNPSRRSENTSKCSLPPVTIEDFKRSDKHKHSQERIMVQSFKDGRNNSEKQQKEIQKEKQEEQKGEGPELIAHDILEFKGRNKLFIQWKPDENCIGYAIYYNKGENWETATEKKVEMVNPETFHFETEELEGCWSIFVKSVNKNHKESLPSKIFTSCSV